MQFLAQLIWKIFVLANQNTLNTQIWMISFHLALYEIVFYLAVERVLHQGTHKLDGATLQVKLYEPPKPIPMYPNRVLIKNLNPETSKDGIINYLEAKTGHDVTDVAFGQEEGTVLVTFEELTGLLLAYCFTSLF